jgi:hypothetical protein
MSSAQYSGQIATSFEAFFMLYLQLSPAIFGIGIFFFVLSFLFSTSHKGLTKPKIVGTYNPAFDPTKKKRDHQSHHYEYISIGLIILGVIPWIVKYMVISPPTL